MKTVKVCVGSACNIKGAPDVIERYKRLIEENALQCDVVLKGCFCMKNCSSGVSVELDGTVLNGLDPAEAEVQFRKLIMGE